MRRRRNINDIPGHTIDVIADDRVVDHFDDGVELYLDWYKRVGIGNVFIESRGVPRLSN